MSPQRPGRRPRAPRRGRGGRRGCARVVRGFGRTPGKRCGALEKHAMSRPLTAVFVVTALAGLTWTAAVRGRRDGAASIPAPRSPSPGDRNRHPRDGPPHDAGRDRTAGGRGARPERPSDGWCHRDLVEQRRPGGDRERLGSGDGGRQRDGNDHCDCGLGVGNVDDNGGPEPGSRNTCSALPRDRRTELVRQRELADRPAAWGVVRSRHGFCRAGGASGSGGPIGQRNGTPWFGGPHPRRTGEPVQTGTPEPPLQ